MIAPQRDLTPGVVEIEDGRVVRVRAGSPHRADVVVRSGILAPGLIDLQINGAAGVDFLSCDSEAQFGRALRYLASTGVTGFLPTLISAQSDHLREAMMRWRRFATLGGGPRILGVHLEGPYLNPAFCGAHNPRHLRAADPTECAALLSVAPGLVRIVTLAPELRGALQVMRVARDRGCVVSVGHTNATGDEARLAFAAGASMVSHLFNAMRPIHHREPGVIIAALEDPEVTVSLIADLVHVHASLVRLTVAVKGWRRVALVTDALAAAGTKQRITRLGGRKVRVTDAPRLSDGTLAGSVLSLDQAVRNAVAIGVPLRAAVLMASAVPAAALGRRDLGQIAPGAWADFAIFDRALRPVATYVAGEQVYARARPSH